MRASARRPGRRTRRDDEAADAVGEAGVIAVHEDAERQDRANLGASIE